MDEGPGTNAAAPTIRPVGPEDRPWILDLMRSEWGSEVVVGHGTVFRPAELPGVVAESGGERVGLVTYRIEDQACEMVTVNSLARGRGVASALVEAVTALAREAGCTRLWAVTTNDNLDGLRFYQRRGFRLVALHPGAVDRSRQLKPEISLVGDYGIPLRDELVVERRLDA